jgi:hypothetical protein
VTPASVRVEAPPGHVVAAEELPGPPTGRRRVRLAAVGDRLPCPVGFGVAAAGVEGATWRR